MIYSFKMKVLGDAARRDFSLSVICGWNIIIEMQYRPDCSVILRNLYFSVLQWIPRLTAHLFITGTSFDRRNFRKSRQKFKVLRPVRNGPLSIYERGQQYFSHRWHDNGRTVEPAKKTGRNLQRGEGGFFICERERALENWPDCAESHMPNLQLLLFITIGEQFITIIRWMFNKKISVTRK